MDSIVLGQPWRSAPKHGAAVDDTLNTLSAGVFGGAEGIRVRRDTSGIVVTIEFDYATERDISRMIADYRTSLGAPAESTIDATDGRQVMVWRDTNTEFRIIRFTPPLGNLGATATLSDRPHASGRE